MYKKLITSFLVLLIALTINAQTINLYGKVTNLADKPIAGATVELLGQNLNATTGTDGSYKIAGTNIASVPQLTPQNKILSLDKGNIGLSLPQPSMVKIDFFDLKGKMIGKEPAQFVSAGFYNFNIRENIRVSGIFIVRVTVDQEEVTFRYLPLSSGEFTFSSNGRSNAASRKLAKIAAIDDTLKITANGYTTKKMAITSYDQELNIKLDTIETVGRSAGCGKSTTHKGEKTLQISTGGKNRSYILRLPDDYDPNKPYRLIFSIHCLNGSARGVASGGNGNNYEYYGLWKMANPKNGPGTTIFCSPEGLPVGFMGGGLGWSNTNDEDVEFFRAMLTKFKEELCIDTTRVFAEGFSMGGSMSYALSCAMPNKFRAICMHSGGSMSGCSGKERAPTAMFITHGTKDDVCTWTGGSGVNQLNEVAKRNGCDTEDLINKAKPTDQSGKTPVTVNYKNCNPAFPCKASIFIGGHDPSPGGERDTWVDDSTWNFFKQF